MAIRGLAKFKQFTLNWMRKEQETNTRKVKQSYSWRMDKPIYHNCDWPVRWWEEKLPPTLETGKVVLQTSHQETLEETSRFISLSPYRLFRKHSRKQWKASLASRGCQQRSSSQVRSKQRGAGVQVVDLKASSLQGAIKRLHHVGCTPSPLNRLIWPRAKTCHWLQTTILANIQRN